MSESKLPWLKFFAGDWLSDPALGRCSPSTRGIWMDMVCLMHQLGGMGEISGSPDQLARACRCSEQELNEALDELNYTQTADVTTGDVIVTVKNRRMQRDFKQRVDTRLRVQRYRSNASSNTNVTQERSEVRGQRSEKEEPPTPLEGGKKSHRFDPPEIPEALLHGSKIGLPDAEVRKFVAFYESKGWKVGKNPMVSWHHAMAGWKCRWEENGRPINGKKMVQPTIFAGGTGNL
jgi:hypothetical protein